MILIGTVRVILWRKLLETITIKGVEAKGRVKPVNLVGLLLHLMMSLLLNGWGGKVSSSGDRRIGLILKRMRSLIRRNLINSGFCMVWVMMLMVGDGLQRVFFGNPGSMLREIGTLKHQMQ